MGTLVQDNKELVIAIDGPGGSGKSSVAKMVATTLGILYIDTGAMYRALALASQEANIDLQNKNELHHFLKNIKMEYESSPLRIAVGGVDLGQRIREHHVSKLASVVSQIPEIRDFLVNFQRKLGKKHFCVMEGRDIGTVVFAQAFCKVYLTASPEVRAKRRLEELSEKGMAQGLTMESVHKDIADRDKQDMEREHSPLKRAVDAVLLDTSDLTLAQVVEGICLIAKDKAHEIGKSL